MLGKRLAVKFERTRISKPRFASQGKRIAPAKTYHKILQPLRPRSSMFKRRLIAADQASVFMVMMSVHISSGLVLHQMTSDHIGIHDHSNEQSSSKLVPKVVP
ncbi:hypothetical protein Tco_0390781 [Tanacetum coccineum]